MDKVAIKLLHAVATELPRALITRFSHGDALCDAYLLDIPMEDAIIIFLTTFSRISSIL